MKSKTLSKVTWPVFLWTVAAVTLASTDTGFLFLTKFISKKETNIFVGIPVFTLFILLASRVISYLFLSGHKGQSIGALEFSYRGFYILLTDEARQEWREFIASERKRLNKPSTKNL